MRTLSTQLSDPFSTFFPTYFEIVRPTSLKLYEILLENLKYVAFIAELSQDL